GFLYVLSQHDERFKDAIDKRTVNLFIGWFFVCVFMTITSTFNVANVAHAAGAVLGALLAYALVFRARRALFASIVVLFIFLGLCGATLGRPLVNFSKYGGYEEAKWGYDDLIANRSSDAIRWYRDAVKYQPKIPSFWFNLGIAYERSGNSEAAASAYERA